VVAGVNQAVVEALVVALQVVPEHPVLLPEILDGGVLMPPDPARDRDDQKRPV
jgi:hypothetical protein